MQHTDFTITKASGQPRKPRNQAEFRSVYIADLLVAAEANCTLSNLSNVPELPIRRPTSRTGRKALQETFDADCRRLRREAGVPAVSGPPIPGSELTGHRRWRTLAECRHGGRLSGISRKDQAMPRWQRIQILHYRRYSVWAIARLVGLSHAQVGRVVAGRRWRLDGDPVRSPSVVVNSVRGTPRPWARALALNTLYLSRCGGEAKIYKRLVARQGAHQKGIIKNRGQDQATAVAAATTSYVESLASLNVAAAVQRLNQDSGYQPAAGTYHAATFWQRREPSSTACEDGGS